MAYSLITRNSDASPVIKYTALGALAAGQVHTHGMPVPTILHAHEDASPDPVEYVHALNHFHHVLDYKYHKHSIESVDPILHAHEGVKEHKHTIAYHDETYTYSVTRQTGTDAPIVTADVGTSAIIRVPTGASSTDTENEDIVVELADTQTCGEDADLTVSASFDFGYNGATPNYETIECDTDTFADIYVRIALNETPVSLPVSTTAVTDGSLHKGIVGASPAVETNANGDNNQAIMLDGTDSANGDILGIGTGGAATYSATYAMGTPAGYYFGDEDHWRIIWPPAVSGFTGWLLTYPEEVSGFNVIRFYKLGTSPEGTWANRTCNETLSLNPDMGDIPSDLGFVGTYTMGSDGYGTETWVKDAVSVSYSVDAWYIGAAYKKVAATAFDPTGSYVGIAPNTGTYVISSTASAGTFRVAWKTLPELKYAPIKKAYHGQHQHDITDTPTYTSVEHTHADDTLDYTHTHMYELPTHKHTPTGADFEAHKHTVTLPDHSHEPVVFGIWRTANILSNVTFKRVDALSPWVLFAVDTVPVNYPSPTVGAEEADVEWPVSKATNLTIDMESTADLATDIDIASGTIEAGTQEGERETNQVTIEDIPLDYGDYIAGSPELAWAANAKTALAYHIGKGEAAGTSEEQSLVNTLDDTISILVRNEGVLERMHIGRLPTGIAHLHSYTDAEFTLDAHPHSFITYGVTDHVHNMYLSNPHSHPNKVITTESHKHNVSACDATPHTHVVKSKTDSSAFVTDITNVVDDTFDEDIDSSETVLYLDSTGTDNGAVTGVAAVTSTDNAYSLLTVVSNGDPTLDGDYQKYFVAPNNWSNLFPTWAKIGDPSKTISDNGVGWYILGGVAYRSYADGPVGDYTLYNDPNVYAVVTNAPALGIKDVSISKDITTSAEKKYVPHKALGAEALNSYIWGWTTAIGSPDLSTFDTENALGSFSIQTEDGETDFTMTGVVVEKLHSGI